VYHCAIFRGMGQTIAEMAIFRFFKIVTAAILDFQNVEILGVGSVKMAKMHHRAKFCGDRLNRC